MIWYKFVNHLLFYVKENQISPTYSPLNFFIFLSLQFSNIKKNSSFFSQGLSHTSWNLVYTWTVGWSIMHTWIGLLVFIYSFISSIFFLSYSRTLNFWSHFTLRPTKLKFDTHMGKGLVCCVHQIQAARIYLFLYFSSFFLSLQLAKIKNLHLQNCFNLPLMAMAGGMWALSTLCYIFTGVRVSSIYEHVKIAKIFFIVSWIRENKSPWKCLRLQKHKN